MSGLPGGVETGKLSVWSRLLLVRVCSLTTSATPKEGKEYNHYENDRLASSSLLNIDLQRSELCAENYLLDRSRTVLTATTKIIALQQLYANYRKTDFSGSAQLEYI